MFVALTTLVLAAVSQSAHCTPATSPTKPTKSDATIAAGVPIRTLDIIRNGTPATDECFQTNVQARSVAISQPEGGGLPFSVAIGTIDCETLEVIPAINECFNITGNGGIFTNFALLP